MKIYSVSPRDFLAIYDGALSNIRKGLARYVERRSFVDIHDVRAHIRRLDTAFALLPKPLRTERRMKAYFRKLDRFYKLNTETTDLEVVRRELSALRHIGDSARLLTGETQERNLLTRGALRLAMDLLSRGPPTIRRLDVSKGKLTKRWARVVMEVTRRMDEDYPKVISDADRVAELHRLRRDSRRLRYLLMFVKRSKEVSDLGRLFVEVQDALGAIRDCDATIRFLGASGNPRTYQRASRRESSKRATLYTEFVLKFARRLEERRPFVELL